MKTHPYIAILGLLLCLLLSACESTNPDTDNHGNMQQRPQANQGDRLTIGDSSGTNGLLPGQDAVQEVFVGFSVGVYVGTTDEEKAAILSTFYDAALSGFVDAERSGVMGTAVSLQFHTGDDDIYIDIITGRDAQYLLIENTRQQLFKKGPADAIDSMALDQLVTDVLSSRTDPNYSGKVTLAGTERFVGKGNTAFAKRTLDDAIAATPITADMDDVRYDITLEVGETLYGISSDTGYFFRQEAGEKAYAQVEDQLLAEVKTRIGVHNATE